MKWFLFIYLFMYILETEGNISQHEASKEGVIQDMVEVLVKMLFESTQM